jgi:hypothetical protein
VPEPSYRTTSEGKDERCLRGGDELSFFENVAGNRATRNIGFVQADRNLQFHFKEFDK